MNFKLVTVATLLGLTYSAQLHAQHQGTDTPAIASLGFLSEGEVVEEAAAVELALPLEWIGEKVTKLLNGKEMFISSSLNIPLRHQLNQFRVQALEIFKVINCFCLEKKKKEEVESPNRESGYGVDLEDSGVVSRASLDNEELSIKN